MRKNSRVVCQWLARSPSTTPGSVSARSIPGIIGFIQQPAEFGGQRPGTGQAHRGAARAVHFQNQLRQQRLAAHRRDGGRQVQPAAQRQGRFLDRAERDDARQQQRLAAIFREEGAGQCLGGAPAGAE